MIVIVEVSLRNFDITTYYEESTCDDYQIIHNVCEHFEDLPNNFSKMNDYLKELNNTYGFTISHISMLLRYGIVSIKYTNICIMDTSNIHRRGQVRSHEIKKMLE
jgi:hypothetical protein